MLGLGLKDTILGLIIAGLLLGGLVGVWRHQAVSDALQTSRATASALRADTARQAERMATLRQMAQAQSDSVAALQARATRLRARLDSADRRGARLRRRAERRAGLLTATAIPSGCDAATRWAGTRADSLTRHW